MKKKNKTKQNLKMLNSVSEMVSKAKRIVNILQLKANKLKRQKEAYEAAQEMSRQSEGRQNEELRKSAGKVQKN